MSMIRKLAFPLGLSLAVIGTAKAFTHTQPSDPFAAFWCHSSDLAASAPGGLSIFGHCWGCYIAAAGVAMIATYLVTGAPRVISLLQTRSR